MKLEKSERRQKKNHRKRYGHTEDGGSVKLIVRIQIEKSQKIKKEKENAHK